MRRAALLLLAVLSACQAAGSGEASGFGGTGQAETPFVAAGRGVVVNVSVSLRQGRAEITIIDPSSQVRFEAEVDPSSPLVRTLRLEGNPGRWLAVLDYSDAEGTRSVEWSTP
ncbi:hypothetical protein BH20CHL7_BH20CHL7_18070 [soil metagenome]